MNFMRHKIKPIPNNDQTKSIEQIDISSRHQKNTSSHKVQQGQKTVMVIYRRKLKRQHPFLFWATALSIIVISSINIPIFLFAKVQHVFIFMGVAILFSLLVFLINSCALVDTKTDMLKLYFLFDGITIAVCSGIVFIVGLFLIVLPSDMQILALLTVFFTLDIISFQGNAKVILAYCKYKFWETIVFKLALLIGMLIQMILAVYYIINSFKAIPISDQNRDKLQEMFLLYIFSEFSLYMEIFNKINEKDGSNQLQGYHLINHEGQTQEELLYEEIEQNKDNNASQTTTSKRK